ncbi:MAG: ATP-binding protein [Limisphaerales bacterium]
MRRAVGPYFVIPTRRKVTVVALFASIFALGLVVIACGAYRTLTTEQRTIQSASIEADIIARRAEVVLQTNDLAPAQTVLLGTQVNPLIQAACIYTRDGTVVAKFSRNAEFQFPIPEVDSHAFHGQSLYLFRLVTSGGQTIGHVFICMESPSYLAGLVNQPPIFVSIAGTLFALTLIFALWLQRLLAMKAIEAEPLFPLVPPGAEPAPEPQEILPDEFRLLNRKVDKLSTKVDKIEKQLTTQPKQPKPFPAKSAPDPKPEPVSAPVVHEELPCAILDLNTVTKSVVQTMRAEIEAQQAEVTIQANLPLIFANGSAITQVLKNLISNALTFCPQGSRPRIRIGGCLTGNAVRLWVHDNGLGIAPEEHQFIFTGSDREYLTIVKKGVERMRGQVGFDSAAGQGSTFWIELPKSEAATLN